VGSALSTFNDFMKVTGPSFLTSAQDVVNEAQKHNYLLRRFLKGADGSRVVQGGSTIKDTIMFDEDSTFQFYLPNETFTWLNPQVLEEWEINWRFAVDHMAWTDQEVELNYSSGMTRAAKHHMYKELKRRKEARLWTSMINGMEDALFAQPQTASMEASTGKVPYSIPAFVNEFPYSLWGYYTTASITAPEGSSLGQDGSAALPGAFATVESLNPITEARWRCQQRSYTSALAFGQTYATVTTGTAAVPGPTPTENNILTAFDDMWTMVDFKAPPTKQEYFENGNMFGQFIACSRLGLNTYTRILRSQQDSFVTTSRQDPAYMSPSYAGIDLQYVSNLDAALLYPDSADAIAHTETNGGTHDGPRYYWLNAKYLNPVFHTSRYMYKHDTMRHPNQPFTTIMPVDSWYNCVARSRRRMGIVYPLGSIYT